MMVKHEDNECRIVNVEAQLQQDSNDDIPPVEIQFDRRKMDSSLEAPLAAQNKTCEVVSAAHKRQQSSDPLFLLTKASSSSNGDSVAAAPPTANSKDDDDSGQVPSPSVFLLGEILSGTTVASANSNGNPTSFFPNYIVPPAEVSDMWRRGGDGGAAGVDEGSVMSTSYYDLSDFDPSNWSDTLSASPTMVGLAVVYLTFGLTHPILFIAGTLTAFGTATAVSAGYDYILEGPLGKCFCSNAQSSTIENSTTVEDGKKSSTIQSEQTCSAIAEGDAGKEGTQTQEHNSDESLDNTTVSACNRQRSQISVARVSTNHQLKTMSTVVDCVPMNWIEAHYPKLDHIIVEQHEFFGLNVKELFQVFFADNAPYNYKEFQQKRGDKNIEYGSWQENSDATSPLSMHPNADNPFPHEMEYDNFSTRTLSFQAKTNNSFLGPPYATTTKDQKLLILNKRLGVLEMKTTLADIPFCDRFYVLERWIFSADKDDSGNYKCCITTSLQVFFVKSCPFESQIRTKTKSSVHDVAHSWLHMATQALLLAEQHKQERIRQEQIVDQEDFTMSDEHDGEVGLMLDEVKKDEEASTGTGTTSEEDPLDNRNIEITRTDFNAICKNEQGQLPRRRSFLRQQSSVSAASSSGDNAGAPPKRNLSLQRLAQLLSSPGRRRKNTAES